MGKKCYFNPEACDYSNIVPIVCSWFGWLRFMGAVRLSCNGLLGRNAATKSSNSVQLFDMLEWVAWLVVTTTSSACHFIRILRARAVGLSSFFCKESLHEMWSTTPRQGPSTTGKCMKSVQLVIHLTTMSPTIFQRGSEDRLRWSIWLKTTQLLRRHRRKTWQI